MTMRRVDVHVLRALLTVSLIRNVCPVQTDERVDEVDRET